MAKQVDIVEEENGDKKKLLSMFMKLNEELYEIYKEMVFDQFRGGYIKSREDLDGYNFDWLQGCLSYQHGNLAYFSEEAKKIADNFDADKIAIISEWAQNSYLSLIAASHFARFDSEFPDIFDKKHKQLVS